jgi:hypothetical protein
MSLQNVTELQLSYPFLIFAIDGKEDISLKGKLSRSEIYSLLFGITPDENSKSWILIKSLDGLEAKDGHLIKGQSVDDPAFKSRQAYTFDEFIKYYLFNENNALNSSSKGTIPIGRIKGSLERNILSVLYDAASKRNNSISRTLKTHNRALRVVQSKIKIMDRTLNATETSSSTNKNLWLEVDSDGKIPFNGSSLQTLTDYAKSDGRKANALTKIFESDTLVFTDCKDSKVPIKKLLMSLDGNTVKDYYSDGNCL